MAEDSEQERARVVDEAMRTAQEARAKSDQALKPAPPITIVGVMDEVDDG